MVNRFKQVFALATLFLLVSPTSANAADIPFLNWEGGQVQEIVMGGQAALEDWDIELQGNGVPSLPFKKSKANEEGFVVYSVYVPEDIPLGGYSIVATNAEDRSNNEFTVVGAVNVIPSAASRSGSGSTSIYNIVKNPQDLALLIAIFVFLTSVVSTLRARKYSHISFMSSQAGPEESIHFKAVNATFIKRIASAPYRIRVRAIDGLPISILRFLLLRDGELVHRLSHNFYGLLPIAGFFAGVIAVNETERAGGIGSAGLAIFIAVAILGIFDAFSGFAAVIGFWFCQLAIGNVSSFKDILVMISVGISWLLPILFASIIQTAIAKDFNRGSEEEPKFSLRVAGIVVSSFVGAAVFFFGQKLANTVLINLGAARNISILALSILTLALIIRGILDESVLHSDASEHLHEESHLEVTTIRRVSSPATAVGILAIVFAFAFIWSDSAQKSLIIGLIFTAPYFILLVRFNEIKSKFLARVKRNILIESLVTASITFVVFNQISSLPLLSQEKAQWFLIWAGIPGIIHAIYSAACDSSDRQEIIV
jgi:hypothetical protein